MTDPTYQCPATRQVDGLTIRCARETGHGGAHVGQAGDRSVGWFEPAR